MVVVAVVAVFCVVVSIADDDTDAIEDVDNTISGVDDRVIVFVSIVEVIVVSLDSIVVIENTAVVFAIAVMPAALS